MGEKYYSDFLFARDGFITGVGSIIDFGATLSEFNYSLTPEMADRIAIRSDWEAVGDSIRKAAKIANGQKKSK